MRIQCGLFSSSFSFLAFVPKGKYYLPFDADGGERQHRADGGDVLEIVDSFAKEGAHGPGKGE